MCSIYKDIYLIELVGIQILYRITIEPSFMSHHRGSSITMPMFTNILQVESKFTSDLTFIIVVNLILLSVYPLVYYSLSSTSPISTYRPQLLAGNTTVVRV